MLDPCCAMKTAGQRSLASIMVWAAPVVRAADYIEPYQMARSLEQLQEQMAAW